LSNREFLYSLVIEFRELTRPLYSITGLLKSSFFDKFRGQG